jgi:gamma-glutamyl:cysteine ligase YbdK (ATP-grasp superfamily)
VAGSLRLFEAFGIELELMIVRSDDLGVYPIADRVLRAAGDLRLEGEVERDETCWSNELVLHVIELKTNGPRASLGGLGAAFHADVRAIDDILAPLGGRLLGTGMHPWMKPLTDARLWPHGTHEVYRAYDHAFGCRGHGWSNLQSIHVNLPFSGDAEFARLHAAIRLVLPLLPAIAAASPIVEGELTANLDSRLSVYRQNQRLVPSITGKVVPERVYTRAAYEDRILRVIQKDIARLDREGVLDPEWVNSRGAIARFSRGSIEIRVIDAQESASMSVAVAGAAIAVVRALADERFTSSAEQQGFHESRLEPIFTAAVAHGGDAVVDDERLLACYGLRARRCSLRELWTHLASAVSLRSDGAPEGIELILRQGSLSERILSACGRARASDLRRVYGELADCLRDDRAFVP